MIISVLISIQTFLIYAFGLNSGKAAIRHKWLIISCHTKFSENKNLNFVYFILQILIEGMCQSLDPNDSNMLIVVPKKKKKMKEKPVALKKKLSKKERKRLEDIIKRKNQKERVCIIHF